MTPVPQPSRGLVLVVEDEAAIADVLRRYLRREGFGVSVASDGRAALAEARRLQPVAIILDVGLPGMDGTEVCRRLRQDDNWVPILFCTARDDEIDRVLGLEMGADDYITKPFSPREVVARVRATLRRAGGTPGGSSITTVGPVSVDLDGRTCTVDGVPVELTATEFDLLAHLMGAPGRVFSRDQLLSEVWGYAAALGTRTVDVHVAQVRSKVGVDGLIRTVRGVGYSVPDPGDAGG